jgi:hypothetical protein
VEVEVEVEMEMKGGREGGRRRRRRRTGALWSGLPPAPRGRGGGGVASRYV